MGTDCASLLANLFLFYYEYRYMKGLIKNNIILGKRFNFTTRYIDDVLTLDNSRFVPEISIIFLLLCMSIVLISQIYILAFHMPL